MDKKELLKIFKAPYARDSWKEVIAAIFPKSAFQNVEDLDTKPKEALRISVLATAMSEEASPHEIKIVEVELDPELNKSLARSRVSLRKIVTSLFSTYGWNSALVAFHQAGESTWRFSLVSQVYEWDDDSHLIKKATQAKRYTFLLGPKESCRTSAERIGEISGSNPVSLERLLKAFSVESISVEFFKEYKGHYERFVEYIAGYRYVKEKGKLVNKKVGPPVSYFTTAFKGNDKDARDFAKKMLGRLVFIYFVQKKEWMLVPGESDPEKRLNLLNALFERCPDKDQFYKTVLQGLFFETLNTIREDDTFILPDGSTTKVPFLNGGLFHPDVLDVRTLNQIVFPGTFFSNPAEIETPHKRGFFDFLTAYNFTIDEDNPRDHTMAVDPEMLGHIFENLLEENKSKGAYYTPKRVVHFMCQESLIGYVYNKLPTAIQDDEHKQILREFFRDEKQQRLLDADMEKTVLVSLKEMKVCDPAIGSGAFPMGILMETFQAVESLLDTTDLVQEVWNLKDWDPAVVKLKIIENCIYGVDLDRGAVDIARLRFWLSLIVDEETPHALPNFDYKIVTGDSLLGRLGELVLEIDWSSAGTTSEETQIKELLARLSQVKRDYFEDGGDKDLHNLEIRNIKIEILLLQINIERRRLQGMYPMQQAIFAVKKTKKELEKEAEIKSMFDALERAEKDLAQVKVANGTLEYFDWGLDFAEIMNPRVTDNLGFDIVIANPPYMRVQEIEKVLKPYKSFLEKNYVVAEGAYDLANLFFEKARTLSKPTASNAFIFPHKFFNSDSGEQFRKFLMIHKPIRQITHFGANMVFKDADTYTCVCLFGKSVESEIQLMKTPFGSDYLSIMEVLEDYQGITYTDIERASNRYGENNWIFFSKPEEYAIFDKIYESGRKFDDVFENIFQGIATSKDGLYFLTDVVEDGDYIQGYVEDLEKVIRVESKFFKPVLKGKEVHRYETLKTNSRVFFPYIVEGADATAVTLEELKKSYPLTYQYVIENEKLFKARESGKAATKAKPWFGYIYPKSMEKFDHYKLSSMEICASHPNVALNSAKLYHNTKVYSWIKKREVLESYDCLLAIANSSLLWWFLKNTGDTLQGDARTFKTNYLNPFPMPKEISEAVDAKIAELVTTVIDLKYQGKKTESAERWIDAIVYRLYDLTFSEAIIIDPKFPFTEAAYTGLDLNSDFTQIPRI